MLVVYNDKYSAYSHNLTIGKAYELQTVKRSMPYYYWIIDDSGREAGYDKSSFMNVEEYRDYFINIIVNEDDMC
jgi:hypothetical protein